MHFIKGHSIIWDTKRKPLSLSQAIDDKLMRRAAGANYHDKKEDGRERKRERARDRL